MSRLDTQALQDAVRRAAADAGRLFDTLRAPWPQGGVYRDSYGPGEQRAFDAVREAGVRLGLQANTDFAGNLFLTWAGRDRAAPVWLSGSHLDSVPDGGNFDGAAGVVAALTAVQALQRLGHVPPRDIVVCAWRAEEASSWLQGDFDSHIGARAALGLANEGELQRAQRVDGSGCLHDLMRAAGLQPDSVRPGHRSIDPQRCQGYLELHIEQGPVLVEERRAVGIVTGIRGSARARNARCTGEVAHSGAVPHAYRRDALLACAEFCWRMDEAWRLARERGEDLVFTVGRLGTDPAVHSMTKVPGHVAFSIDLRSQDRSTLDAMVDLAHRLAGEISAQRGVELDLGRFNVTEPARMDARCVASLVEGAQALALDALHLPSGAGHDAQELARAGIPTGMIFVRNDRGSHNPQEAMDMDDFIQGTQLLAWQLAQ